MLPEKDTFGFRCLILLITDLHRNKEEEVQVMYTNVLIFFCKHTHTIWCDHPYVDMHIYTHKDSRPRRSPCNEKCLVINVSRILCPTTGSAAAAGEVVVSRGSQVATWSPKACKECELHDCLPLTV